MIILGNKPDFFNIYFKRGSAAIHKTEEDEGHLHPFSL